MWNEAATGLEHLIPANGDEFDLFAFGFQESTYDVKKDTVIAMDSIDKIEGEGRPRSTSETKSPDRRMSTGREQKELACVEMLQNQLISRLGNNYYLVS